MLINHMGNIASFIGSLTVVGSTLMFIFNKLVLIPKEKRRKIEEEERNALMIKMIVQENNPLNESIKKLNDWLNESKQDRTVIHKQLNSHEEILKEHEKRLDFHEKQITILDTKIK